MRKIRMLFWSVLVCCFFFSSMTVVAADDRLGTVVDGSLLTDGSEAEGIAQPKTRGTYLGFGSGRITLNSKRNVNVYGSTTCNRTSDQVKVTMHLQRLVGNTWANVCTFGPTIAYNTYFVSKSHNYDVTGGYYYRVKGSHTAVKGSTMETAVSYTDGIWVE